MIRLNRLVVVLLIVILVTPIAGANKEAPILDSERYFPDDIGLQWTYSGSVADQIQRVSDYTNTAIVKGKTQKRGVPVVVFWESNQSNRGQAESYLSKNKEGITYFGGNPTTDFETQLVPYRVIQFPIVLGKTVVQVEKRNLTYDLDIDHDGVREKADTRAEVAAVAIETVSTPAGTFRDTIKFQGTMTVWITLSRDKKRMPIVDTTTHWFAKDVGMVKQIEKLTFPEEMAGAPTGTITTEVLTEYSKPKSPA
ncbi:MAG: hypothetical protein HY037_03280 [Nitrospirae bacterium]|nr:hypothetical protein [Candidatus Troglogloeales bacterium]